MTDEELREVVEEVRKLDKILGISLVLRQVPEFSWQIKITVFPPTTDSVGKVNKNEVYESLSYKREQTKQNPTRGGGSRA